MRHCWIGRVALAAAITFAITARPAAVWAQTSIYWTGAADNPSGAWNSNESWSSSPTGTTFVPPPTTGDAVVLNYPAGTSPPSYYNLGSLQFQSITLNATGGNPYYGIVSDLPSDVIGLQSGGFIQTVNAFVTINTGLTLNGPATLSVLSTDGGISFASLTNMAGPSRAQPITGTGGLTLVNDGSNGALQISSVNSYTGATTVDGTGTVLFNVNGAVPIGSALTVNGSASFATSSTIGSLAGAGTVTINGGNTLTVGTDNTSTTFSGTLQDGGTGSASLAKVGTGTLTLSGANTYSGGTLISGGTLAVSADNNLGAATTTGGLTFDGGTLQVTSSSFTTSRDITLNSGGGTIGNVSGSYTYLEGNISGSGGLTLDGNGLITLEGTSTYSGPTQINSGFLDAYAPKSLSPASAYTLAPGALLVLGTETVGSLAGGGAVLGTGTFSVGANNTSTEFSGVIADFGSLGQMTLNKIGSGTLTLSGNSTYGANTTISGGTLQLGDGGTSGSIEGSVSNGGTLAFDRSDVVTFTGTISDASTSAPGVVQQLGTGTTILTGSNTYSGGTTISAGTLQLGDGGTSGSIVGPVSNNGTLAFDRSDNALTLGGVISGTGAVQLLGSGTTTLTGNNTYTGGTTITAGTLQLGNGGASGSIEGNVSNNGTLTFDRSDTTTFGGSIGGNGQLIKTGSGTLTLSGASTYTGITDVQAGGLIVNGSLAGSSVNVENAATLGGAGTIANAVTILSGGILAPGSSTGPGTLTVGSLTINPGATLQYSLGTANVPGGSSNSLTNVTGPLALAGTLNVTSSGNFSLGLYSLFNYSGSLLDNGLTVGTLPGTYLGSIQTTIPGQINLIIDSPGILIQFWDGTASSGDGTIHGGSGTWTTAGTNTNWTTPNGAINASWQGGFGIFDGTAQTVTAATPVSYQGLQFSTTGYEVAGPGALTPIGLAPSASMQG